MWLDLILSHIWLQNSESRPLTSNRLDILIIYRRFQMYFHSSDYATPIQILWIVKHSMFKWSPIHPLFFWNITMKRFGIEWKSHSFGKNADSFLNAPPNKISQIWCWLFLFLFFNCDSSQKKNKTKKHSLWN